MACSVCILKSSVPRHSGRTLAENMTRHLPFLLLLSLIGCSNSEGDRIHEQIERDETAIVHRYQAARLSEVETVLKDYLALADRYETNGWGQHAKPGFVERLRGLTEGRLAVFYNALGKPELYRTHMNLALDHLRKSGQDGQYTDEGVRELVDRLDAANIQPAWRNEVSQQGGAANRSQPVSSETNRTSSAAGSGG